MSEVFNFESWATSEKPDDIKEVPIKTIEQNTSIESIEQTPSTFNFESWATGNEKTNKENVKKLTTPTDDVTSTFNFESWATGNETQVTSETTITGEPTTARKAQYGAALETYLLGDLWRLGEAAFTNKSSKQIEKERVKEIQKNFPEFKDGKYDSDAAVWSGRGLVMLTDPVYFLMPWGMAANAGRAYKGIKSYAVSGAATAALGAGVGAGATSIHTAAKGKFNWDDVLVGAGAGAVLSPVALGVTTGVSKVASKVAPKIFGGDKTKAGAVTQILKEDTLKNLNITSKQLTQVKKISSLPEIKRLFKELESVNNNFVSYIQPKRERLLKLNEIKKSLGLINKKTGEVLSVNSNTYRKIVKKLTDKERKVLTGTQKDYDKYATNLSKEINLGLERQAGAEHKYQQELIKQIHSIGGLKSQLGRMLAINLTRPLVGTAMGATGGTIFTDSEEGFNTFVASGFALGLTSRALRSGSLTGIPTNVQQGFARLLNGEYVKNLARQININTSTTVHTKLSARGPIADELSTMIFSKFDTAPRLNFFGNVVEGRGPVLTGISSNIEQLAQSNLNRFTGAIYGEKGILFGASQQTQDEALKIVRGSTEKFNLQSQKLATKIKGFLSDFKSYFNEVGITEAEVITNYFPRKINFNAVNRSKQSMDLFMTDMGTVFQNISKTSAQRKILKNAGVPVGKKMFTPSQGKAAAKKYFESISREYDNPIIGLDSNYGILNSDVNGRFKIVLPLSEHIQHQRVIQGSYDDVEKVIEKWLVNDIGSVLNDLARTSVKSVEFARKFGPDGKLLNNYFDRLKSQYINNGFTKETMGVGGYNKDVKAIADSVNALFGRHGRVGNPTEKNIVATLSTLANLSMMDKVTIANLGDLVQPFQNSRHFGSWLQGIARTNIRTKYEKGGAESLELFHGKIARQLLKDAYVGAGDRTATEAGQASARYIDIIGMGNEKFFKYIGLEGITNVARRYAYNTGIVDGYKSARSVALALEKANVKSFKNLKSLTKVQVEDIQHLTKLGVTSIKDVIKLGKFNTLDEALANNQGKVLLNKIGIKTADRDAIIPTVGNRLLFTQTRNPLVRVLGQFSSWAQAKSAQTNALIARAESGEQAQLFKMAGALTVYGAISSLREYAKYGEVRTNIDDSPDVWLANSMNLSGNMGWLPTYVLNRVVGPGADRPLEIFPGATVASNSFLAITNATGGVFGKQDYDEAIRNFYDALPAPTIRGLLTRTGVPGLTYKGNFNLQKDFFKKDFELISPNLFNQGGYVKELTRRLQQRNN